MPIETDGLVRPETKPRDASPKTGADTASADRSRFLFAARPLATQAAMLATDPAALWRAVGGQVPGRAPKKASPPTWGAAIANPELASDQGAAALDALDVERGTRPYGDGMTPWKRDPEEAKTDGPRDASEAAAHSASTAEALEQRRGAHRQADAVVDADAGQVGVKGAVTHAGGDTTTEGRVTLTEGTRVGYRAERTFVDGDVALMNRGDDPRHAFSVEDAGAPRQTRAWSAGTNGEVDLASGEARLGGTASKVTRVEEGDHVIEHTAAASGRMGVGPGGVTGGEVTLVSGDRDGAAASARATTATVKGENVGVTTKRTRKAADRSSTEASGGVTVDVLGDDKGLTARGAAAKKNAAGETVIGASGRGTLETFGGDRKGAAARGEGSLTAGKVTVTVSGGVSFVVNAPVQRGERWVVAAEQGDQVGGGVGANAGSYGAAVSMSERARTSRDFPFPTRAEALAFFGDTARVKAALDRGLADAGAMKDGERMTHETSTGAGVAGTAKGIVDVSAAIQAARTHRWTVEREGDFATVTVQERLQRGGALGGGAAGIITVGAGRSREGYRTVRVTFDLRQHEQDFLDYIAEPRTELPPEGTYASLTTVDGTSDRENVDVGLGPLAASASNFGSHEEVRTVGADGETHTTTTDVGGQTIGASISALEEGFERTDRLRTQTAGGGRLTAAGSTKVVGSSAETLHGEVLRYWPDQVRDPTPRGDAEQSYELSTRFDPSSLAAVVRAIAGLEPDSTSYLVFRQGEVQALQDALKDAGSDTAKQGAALAAFERATGADGMRWLNSIVAGEPSLVTVGNDVFPGAHAYADYERRLTALETAAGEPGPNVGDREREARDIVVDLSTRRGRQLQQLKPRELPDGIRARELDRSEALLERANTVVARLQAARESQEGRPAQDAPTPEDRTQLSSERSPRQCMERLTPGERSIAMGYLSKARGQFESAKGELDEAYVSAHLEYLSFERLRERYSERLAGYDDWMPRFEEELRYADSGLAHILQLHEEAKAAEAGYDGRSVDPWVTASVSLAKAAALMKTRTERYRATLAMMRTLDVAIGRVGRPAPDPTGAIRPPFGTSAKEAQR